MTDICPELYTKEAENIIKSINIFDNFCCKKEQKYENIANLYKNAGNLYKMKDLKSSYECYEKSLYYFSKIPRENKKNIADCCVNCALTCDKESHELKINYYIKAIDNYLLAGFIDKLPRFYENIADIYLSINDYENAILYYNKVCVENNNYDTCDTILKKEEIYNKLGLIYIINLNDYEKGLEIYKKYEYLYNKNNVKGNLSNHIIDYKKYFIITVLLVLLKNDYSQALVLLSYYESICRNLKDDYNGIRSLIINIQNYNVEKYDIENDIEKKEKIIMSLCNDFIGRINNIIIKNVLNKIIFSICDKNL